MILHLIAALPVEFDLTSGASSLSGMVLDVVLAAWPILVALLVASVIPAAFQAMILADALPHWLVTATGHLPRAADGEMSNWYRPTQDPFDHTYQSFSDAPMSDFANDDISISIHGPVSPWGRPDPDGL